MFFKPLLSFSRKAVMPMLLAAVFSTSTFAYQSAATGLGQSWPNATDVSVSPHYHVYVFIREGIRYIQVNDLNGTVRGAVAVADHVVLTLPVGVDAQYVTASHQAANSADTSAAETVYDDSSMQITATPTASGAIQLNAVMADDCQSWNCTGIAAQKK